eukprot:403370585
MMAIEKQWFSTQYDNIKQEDSLYIKQENRIKTNIKFFCTVLVIANAIIISFQRDHFRIIATSAFGFAFFYYLIDQKQSQIKYIGGYMCIFISFLEGAFLGTEINTKSNFESFSIGIPSIQMVALTQTNINWKQKFLFFAFSRLMLLVTQFIKSDGMSLVYAIAQLMTILLNCVILRDYENILMDIYHMNLLNIKKLEIKAQVEGQRSDTTMKLKFSSFQSLVMQTVTSSNKTSRLQLKIKDWQRHMMFIGNMISEEEILAIFIDTTKQKTLEHKQLSQKMTQDISLYQNQDLSFNYDEFDPRVLVEEIASTFRQFIKCDQNRLRQLLFIMVYNSIKYTNQGFVHVKISQQELSQSQTSENEINFQRNLKIKIQDSGCGMSEEQSNKIFQLLSNIKQIDKVNQHGMGLGLSLCKKIVKAAKDDDAFNLYSLEQLIIQKGIFECDKAKNGQDAITQVLKQHQSGEDMYKFIFMDLNMPVLDGMRATASLRKLHDQRMIDLSETKIFMHSAIESTVKDEQKLFDGILKKPIHFKELDDILEQRQQNVQLIIR